MSEWKEYRLDEIAENFAMGPFGSNIKAENFIDTGVPVIRGKNLNFPKYVDGDYVFLTEEKADQLKSSNCYPGDLVFTHRGTIGQVGLIPEGKYPRYVVSQSGMKVSARKNILDNNFLFYFFKSNIGQYELLQNESQVGVPAISSPLTSLKSVHISLPSLPEQRAIAMLLSSLDDKIDLLHRQNKTLETMAETLFRQWFVEEADEGWEEGELSYFAGNPRNSIKPIDIDANTRYIGLEHIDRRNIALIQAGSASAVTSNKYQFAENDILFGKLRPYFHKVCFAPYEGVCSTDILVIRPKHSHYFAYCLFAFFQDDVIEYANIGSEGTRMPRTNWKMISQYSMKIPDEETMKKFNQLIAPSIEKNKKNQTQIRTLEKMRDTLLPKLMSGEVRVKH